MSIYEYDEERELKLIRADEREIGREEERKKTEAERREKEIALKRVEEAVENTIRSIVSVYKKFDGKKEDAIEEVSEKCNLSKEAAREKVNTYWD